MNAPKMILFDYGHTLCYEADTDFLRGERAVFEHVTANPHGITPEEACALGTKLFSEAESVRRAGYEIHEWPLLRLKYESLGLRFDLPIEELEIVLADAAAPDGLMPGAEDMLAELRRRGIRTGVISNLGWSGNALSTRLRKMLPEHSFEFILPRANTPCANRTRFCLRSRWNGPDCPLPRYGTSATASPPMWQARGTQACSRCCTRTTASPTLGQERTPG